MRRDLRDYLGPPTARNKRMFDATLFAHGIKRYDDKKRLSEYHTKLLRSKSESKSRERWRFLYLRYRHDKKAHLAVDDPLAWIKQQVERRKRRGHVPKIKEVKEMLDVAHLKEDDPLAWLRFRIDQQVQELGRVPKFKELAEMLDVPIAQLYRAEPGLMKKLKRRFLDDATAPTERQKDKPWLSAAKMKRKEKLNPSDDRD
jgi:hypothetical protein